jgi:hypothetical protein
MDKRFESFIRSPLSLGALVPAAITWLVTAASLAAYTA